MDDLKALAAHQYLFASYSDKRDTGMSNTIFEYSDYSNICWTLYSHALLLNRRGFAFRLCRYDVVWPIGVVVLKFN